MRAMFVLAFTFVAAVSLSVSLSGSAAHLVGAVAAESQREPANTPDILALLERDVQGKISPFLAGRCGSGLLDNES